MTKRILLKLVFALAFIAGYSVEAQMDDQSLPPFFQELATDGAWIKLAEDTWAWQPTAMQLDQEWRPYLQAGSWVRNDDYWFWVSEYSWGAIAFHHGRWLFTDSYGWIWFPDQQWSPAWVNWYLTDTHAGWTPLPPSTNTLAKIGLEDYRIGGEHAVYVPNQFITAKNLLPFLSANPPPANTTVLSFSGPEISMEQPETTLEVAAPTGLLLSENQVLLHDSYISTPMLTSVETVSRTYYSDPFPIWASWPFFLSARHALVYHRPRRYHRPPIAIRQPVYRPAPVIVKRPAAKQTIVVHTPPPQAAPPSRQPLTRPPVMPPRRPIADSGRPVGRPSARPGTPRPAPEGRPGGSAPTPRPTPPNTRPIPPTPRPTPPSVRPTPPTPRPTPPSVRPIPPTPRPTPPSVRPTPPTPRPTPPSVRPTPPTPRPTSPARPEPIVKPTPTQHERTRMRSAPAKRPASVTTTPSRPTGRAPQQGSSNTHHQPAQNDRSNLKIRPRTR